MQGNSASWCNQWQCPFLTQVVFWLKKNSCRLNMHLKSFDGRINVQVIPLRHGHDCGNAANDAPVFMVSPSQKLKIMYSLWANHFLRDRCCAWWHGTTLTFTLRVGIHFCANRCETNRGYTKSIDSIYKSDTTLKWTYPTWHVTSADQDATLKEDRTPGIVLRNEMGEINIDSIIDVL